MEVILAWQEKYLDRYYRSRPDWRDGTTCFFEFIKTHIPSDGEVLELGAGPDNRVSEFLAKTFRKVDGLDVDPAVGENGFLNQAMVYDGEQWPIEDARYDAVVANYVLEHVENPHVLIKELHRVLRPGGVFIFRTPNKRHYVSLASRYIPHWFHHRIANHMRNLDGDNHDTYPTFYRLNSSRKIKKLFMEAGFEQDALRAIEKEPSYGMSNRLFFWTFLAYERLVNSTSMLAGFRSNWLGVFRKPKGAPQDQEGKTEEPS